MNGDDYVDKYYPEADYEDNKFSLEDLYDGIANAYDQGKSDAPKIDVKTADKILEYLNSAWREMSDIDYISLPNRDFVHLCIAKHCIDDARDLIENIMEEQ